MDYRTATDNPSTRAYYHRRFTALRNEFRESWAPHLAELKEYLAPYAGRHLSGDSESEANDGSKRGSAVYDDVPQSALSVLQGGLQSGLTSPARPWFRLATQDEELNSRPDVKQWLYTVEERMRAVFNRSNIYNATHEMYGELAVFGTSATLLEFDFRNVIHATVFTAGQYYLDVNDRGQVNTFTRRYYMTAEQIVRAFGEDRASPGVRQAYRGGATQRFPVIQFIEPNDDDRVSLDGFHKPWRSIYWEDGSDTATFLRVGGYEEFPVLSPRWNIIADDVYGTSLGMRLLADVKMLYDMQRCSLVATHKAISPPIAAPSGQKTEMINSIPGGITYEVDAGTLRPLHTVDLRLDFLEAKINNVKDAIRQGFFNNLFLMLASMDRRQMTATEVAERHQEKLTLLGPVLARLHTELLDPLIDRTFGILLRTGALPPPPEELSGADLRVEYISILAQAQKMIGLTGLQQTLGFAGNLAAVDPTIMDVVNLDRAMYHYADYSGTPPDILRDPEEVAAIRQQRAQQAQAQQMAEQGATMAQGAKVLSEASLGENNVLSALMGGRGRV